ncbi:MAG: sensor histidine kinase EsaS [Rhodoferax sp.]
MSEAPSTPVRSRAVQWTLGLGLAALGVGALGLLFLLIQATTNQGRYEQWYGQLVLLNTTLALVLLLLMVWIGWRLLRRFRARTFGSRLLLRLAAVFALAGFAPGMLIYVVSYQFITRSIESWFDVRVETALQAGLNLGRATLDAAVADWVTRTRNAAGTLAEVPDALVSLPLERVRDTLDADALTLWRGVPLQLVGASGKNLYQLAPEQPPPTQLRVLRRQPAVGWIEGLDDTASPGRVVVRALLVLPNAGFDTLREPRYLMATHRLPQTLVDNALAVTQANREYQERALSRDGLRRMYVGTLTLTLFLAVFGAVLLAVLIGNQIARPLLLLAEGVRQVAAGDLRPKTALQGRDELDGLTRSFALMTEQLADARLAVQRSMSQVDAARAHLQTILDNLTTGVVVLDGDNVILSVNPGATRILRCAPEQAHARVLSQIDGLSDFGDWVAAQFADFFSYGPERQSGHWQQSFELGDAAASPGSADAHGRITLLVRGAALPGQQRLLVFDDISAIVSAQRAQAWGEVARRLAHEIKNPLTPIRLAAERLQLRLRGKIGDSEQALLDKSVRTIVEQVDAMKRLVNEFRDYARLPAPHLAPVDLNALVGDVLGLYAPELTDVPIRTELDPQCPCIAADAQQLRQVLHNLLQNAQDATRTAGRADAQHPVRVRTQWIAASRSVRLSVIDEGTGFADPILKRVFEPYVTTKEKGTGLGLAMVKKIADEHGARVEVINRQHEGAVIGAQVSLSFHTDRAALAAVS